MFDLSEADLALKIVDCGGGPASFVAEMHAQGRHAVACDPLYHFSVAEISQRIRETHRAVTEANRRHRDNFLWQEYQSPERLGELRMESMAKFLADLPGGIEEQRYLAAELPNLPCKDQEFGLALCSHLLFTYDNVLSPEFHVDAIKEMCRIAAEARIFPVMPQFGVRHSVQLDPVIKALAASGYACEIKQVPYEFQKGGNQMLVVRRAPD
jgi:hypothetical protein